MRLLGWCRVCHKFRYVRVTNNELVLAQARKSNVIQGICADCEK